MVNYPVLERYTMKRIVVRKPGTAKLTGTSSVIHQG